MTDRQYPQEFLDEVRAILGGEFDAFRAAMNEEARRALRINPLRAQAEEAAAEFILPGGLVPWEPLGRRVPTEARPGRSIAHECGAFYLQDASAMAPAAVLDPQPGERVLDLCAAPGGKSGQIAARLKNEGFLLANEIDPARARVLSGNLERLGVRNACVTNADAATLARALPGFFDAVLVDAPCSGEGMFRRDPEAVRQWNSGAPSGCAARQRDILLSAAQMVRPGGRLVYSTCTFNRAENEGSIRDFLAARADFAPDDFSLPGVGTSREGCLRLWPHKIEGEGHFVARLRRDSACEEPKLNPSAKERARGKRRAEEAALLSLEDARKLLAQTVIFRLPAGDVRVDGESLRLIPLSAPPLSALAGVRVLRMGLPLARVGRGRVEPEHALAMAISPEDALHSVSLSDADAVRYLAGEALSAAGLPEGWTLICWRGLPLGWGKSSAGILKNHLPKGLRRRGGHALSLDAKPEN